VPGVPLAALRDAIRPGRRGDLGIRGQFAEPDHLLGRTNLANRPSLVVPAGPG